MKISVVGTGYVGLVAGTCFAESGNDVVCVDVDEKKVAALRGGEVPIYEPGLEELIKRNVRHGRLSFQTDLVDAVLRSEICFIAVGTPEGEGGEADLTAVMSVARGIGEAMDGYRIIVDKSTVPVGTAAQVEEVIRSCTEHRFDVVSNPEFLKEGAAIDDFQKPDRVVIGCRSERSWQAMEELYKPFVRTGKPILRMSPESAEMTKYAANAMLAARISLMNEVANLCEATGSDVEDVRRGVGLDERLGSAFLFPGVGYGGSCFPKDVKALIKVAENNDLEARILRAVDEVNDRQKQWLFKKAKRYVGADLSGARAAVWGLSFKPRTDDMREAPSVVLIKSLLDAGASIATHDPVAMPVARRLFNDSVDYFENPYEALEGADCLLIVTEWQEFKQPDFDRIKSLLKSPLIIDGRNLYDRDAMERLGFRYVAVGRQPVGAGGS